MTRFDYETSKHLLQGDPPFYALIMAAMRKADDENLSWMDETGCFLSIPPVYTEFVGAQLLAHIESEAVA